MNNSLQNILPSYRCLHKNHGIVELTTETSRVCSTTSIAFFFSTELICVEIYLTDRAIQSANTECKFFALK